MKTGRFGTYRLGLAILVVLAHFGPWASHNSGLYAVFAFFMLSGYLMTLILHEKYGFSLAGLRNYARNRFLKIFPMYWVAVIYAAIVIAVLPSASLLVSPKVDLPSDAWEWIRVLSLGYIWPDQGEPYLLIPAWSLAVEVIYYALIPVLARTKRSTLAWLMLSLCYAVWSIWTQPKFSDFYFSAITATVPFSVGAALYHFRHLFKRLRPSALLLLGPAYVFLSIFGKGLLGENPQSMYASMLVSGLILATLVHTRVDERDAKAGELSYPVYLLHFQTIPLLAALGLQPRSLPMFLAGIGPVLVLSWLFARFLEPRIARVKAIPALNSGSL